MPHSVEGPIHRIVHWISSAYYLSWAVGIIGAAAAMAAELPGIGPALRNLFYYLAGVLALSFVSLLYAHRRARHEDDVLNPKLALRRADLEYWISPESVRALERATYEATGHVDVMGFSYAITGTATAKLALRSSGELRGPVVRADNEFYQIVFPTPLAKRDRYLLEIETIVIDPDRTMKPFITQSYSNSSSDGSLNMRIHFGGANVNRVFYAVNRMEAGPFPTPISELFPSQDGSVEVHVSRVRAGYEYSVSWSWSLPASQASNGGAA